MADKPIDLGVIRGERKETCNFCGQEAHEGDYQCDRISYVWFGLDGGQVTEIEVHLKDEWEPVAG